MAPPTHPLHICHVKKTEMTINRLHILLHGSALIALFYYRLTTLSQIIRDRAHNQTTTPLIPYLLLISSEALLTFLWLLHRPYKWRPLKRTAFPERLPADEKLPPVDIFICTADPGREPSLNVMNTVISAMALDYPPEKLAVYLQDDGGAPVTRRAVREAYKFARFWVPFCRKYNVQSSRCPDKFFSSADEIGGREFAAERKIIEEKYEEFKESLVKNLKVLGTSVSNDHPAIVEVINEDDEKDDSKQKGPLLVYVSREKRPSHPHNFKAGAINTLIRVSAVMSNAPYLLLLDCDHYCNDPSSARQAMCFHLDPEISPKLSFVQFPQRFHNIGEHDIYDGRLNYFKRRWHGADGLGGPVITGCNMYMKRDALYGNIKNGLEFNELRSSFGSSNTLINSIYRNYKSSQDVFSRDKSVIPDALEKEVQLVASSTYDTQSLWGKQVGFIYFSVVEDIMTSEKLHREGWTSVWVDPPKPCFLGSSPTDLTTSFFQQSRWGLGLMQIALSKHCSLFYGRGKMSILHCISYAALTFDALYVVPFYGLAIVPQICLLNSIPLYPKVSDPFFVVFAFIFVSTQLKHVHEVMMFGDSIRTMLYELRIWMMKSASCYLYATLDAFLDKFGYQEAVFNLTDKVVDDEREKRFKKGIYDFQGSKWFITPICSLYILNVVAFVVGAAKIIQSGRGADHELFAQAFISFFGIIVNYHVFAGMVLRKDKGRVSTSLTLVSIVIATFIMGFGSLLLIYL